LRISAFFFSLFRFGGILQDFVVALQFNQKFDVRITGRDTGIPAAAGTQGEKVYLFAEFQGDCLHRRFVTYAFVGNDKPNLALGDKEILIFVPKVRGKLYRHDHVAPDQPDAYRFAGYRNSGTGFVPYFLAVFFDSGDYVDNYRLFLQAGYKFLALNRYNGKE
jgi:hypothetical protein